MHSKRHSHGFTLLELMITLAIAALLVTIVIPGFNGLIKKNRISTYANNLVTSLALARSEAVKRGTIVSLCASNTGNDCTATGFDQGWIVFTDRNTAGSVDGTDTILRVQDAIPGLDFTITGNALVQYRPNGLLVASADMEDHLLLAEASTTLLVPTLGERILSSLLPGTLALASPPEGGPPGQGGEEPPGQGGGEPTDPLRTGVTNFDICTENTSGESGILVVVSITGRISTLEITCS